MDNTQKNQQHLWCGNMSFSMNTGILWLEEPILPDILRPAYTLTHIGKLKECGYRALAWLEY